MKMHTNPQHAPETWSSQHPTDLAKSLDLQWGQMQTGLVSDVWFAAPSGMPAESNVWSSLRFRWKGKTADESFSSMFVQVATKT